MPGPDPLLGPEGKPNAVNATSIGSERAIAA
jgi:hypothetical protein